MKVDRLIIALSAIIWVMGVPAFAAGGQTAQNGGWWNQVNHQHRAGCGHPGYEGNAPKRDASPTQKATTAPGTPVSEPGDFALFLIGVTGLLIGRRASRGRKARTEERLDV